MAEKEERILCIETDEKIVECGYGDFYNTMTRQEAIEKMLNGVKKFQKKLHDNRKMEMPWFTDKDAMEAALNALLSMEK